MELDELDVAWVNSVCREGEMVSGFLAIVTTLDEFGEQSIKVYNQTDRTMPDLLGLLEYAKHRFIAEELFAGSDDEDDPLDD